MSSLFSRGITDGHPCWRALIDLDNSSFVDERAMARNLMHDHRVDPAREHAFADFLVKPLTRAHYTKDELQDGVVDYFDNRVRTRRDSGFLVPRLNAGNFVEFENQDLKLVRAIVLNNLGPVFDYARDAGIPPFTEDMPSSEQYLPNDGETFHRDIHKWLCAKMQNGQTEFVEQVLMAINEKASEAPFQPSWVGLWDQFRGLESSPPETWLEVLGVPSRDSPQWVVVLRYTVREAGDFLVRPTQLDAEWCAHHFPSPPQAPLIDGGYPIDLRMPPPEPPPDPPLRSEFIHEQVDHVAGHIYLIGQTGADTSPDLGGQRRAHHRSLKLKYGGNRIKRWMPKPC